MRNPPSGSFAFGLSVALVAATVIGAQAVAGTGSALSSNARGVTPKAGRGGGPAERKTLPQAQESVLYAFLGDTDGNTPDAPLLADSTGALYGTTSSGGFYGRGDVFKLTPSGSGFAESILYTFGRLPDGGLPVAGLIADAAGNLYGTTEFGGSGACNSGVGCGTVFKLAPAGSGYAESVLYSFRGGKDGNLPQGALLADAAGALYGTTGTGGSYGGGIAFKLTPTPSGYNESVLHSFGEKKDGRGPLASLISDTAGALYGTTVDGGDDDQGTVFKLTPSGSKVVEKVLYSFKAGNDGSGPLGALIADSTGALYSTTASGGSKGGGTVFKLTPSGGGHYVESILYAFKRGNDAESPQSGLYADAKGALYGTTYLGGAGPCSDGSLHIGCGAVFKLTPSKNGYKESVLYSFQGGSDGWMPFAGLIADSTGALYGTTASGGVTNTYCHSPGCGVVFKVTQ